MRSGITALSLTLLFALVAPASGQLIAPDQLVAGQSQLALAEQYSSWLITQPVETNPMLDNAGAQAFRGNQGSVFFLVGTLNPEPVTRTITVPAGGPLFTAVFSSTNDNTAPRGQPPTNYSAADLVNMLVPLFDPSSFTSLFVQIDGISQGNIFNYRQTTDPSAPFSYTTTSSDNWIDQLVGSDTTMGSGVFPSTVFPVVQDGYWVALQPFAPASMHTVSFGGESSNFGFEGVTYDITTTPEPASGLVAAAGLMVALVRPRRRTFGERGLPSTTTWARNDWDRTGNRSPAMGHAGSRCLGLGLIVFLSILAGSSQGQVTPIEDSALAPIRFLPNGSFNPTAAEWNNAAMQSLRQGGGAVGDASSDPSAYLPIDTVGQSDFTGTDTQPDATFPSWRGVANPSGLFANEYGTALAFPLRLVSATTKFKLSNLDNIVSSNDPNDVFSALSHSAQGLNFAYNRIGIDYGPDGLPNTADDIVYANGESGNLPVNELLTSGIGTYLPTFNLSSSDQGDIDQSVANFFSQNPLTQISNEYLLYDDSGNLLADVTKSVAVTPEPAALSCLGVLAIPLLRKRR